MNWTNEKPWHEIGVEVDAKVSAREMLAKGKIDRQVSKNKRLKSIENEKAFRFFKSFAEAGDTHIETIGHLENERIVWALARLNEGFTLNDVDKVEGYLLLASRNETRESIQAQFLAVRMVCHNMQPVAIKARTTFGNIFLTATKFDQALEKKAQETLTHGRSAIASFASEARLLASKKVDENTAHRYMLDVFQPETSKTLPTIGQKEIAELAEDKTRNALEAIAKAPGNDLPTAKMTAWGLVNAATYMVDHHLGKNPDFRLRQAWFGTNAKTKQRALDLALALP